MDAPQTTPDRPTHDEYARQLADALRELSVPVDVATRPIAGTHAHRPCVTAGTRYARVTVTLTPSAVGVPVWAWVSYWSPDGSARGLSATSIREHETAVMAHVVCAVVDRLTEVGRDAAHSPHGPHEAA